MFDLLEQFWEDLLAFIEERREDLVGIVLTHDAWPMLREALGSLDGNGLSDGVVPTALIVGALVLFAGFALRRSRRIVTGQSNVPVGAAWLWGPGRVGSFIGSHLRDVWRGAVTMGREAVRSASH